MRCIADAEALCNPARIVPLRSARRIANVTPFSGRGETPHRRLQPASAPVARQGVSRSGEIPGPTVTVRMEENGRDGAQAPAPTAIALGPFWTQEVPHD